MKSSLTGYHTSALREPVILAALNDNAEPDFLDDIRDPTNGFMSVTLPIKQGTELAVKIA